MEEQYIEDAIDPIDRRDIRVLPVVYRVPATLATVETFVRFILNSFGIGHGGRIKHTFTVRRAVPFNGFVVLQVDHFQKNEPNLLNPPTASVMSVRLRQADGYCEMHMRYYRPDLAERSFLMLRAAIEREWPDSLVGDDHTPVFGRKKEQLDGITTPKAVQLPPSANVVVPPLNEETLRRLNAEGRTQRDIAKICHSNRETVNRKMRAWNIPAANSPGHGPSRKRL